MAWLLGILLLDEGVGDGLHAILRQMSTTSRSAPAHHQPSCRWVPCELVLDRRGLWEKRGGNEAVWEGAQRCAWVGRSGVWGLGEGRQAKLPPPTSASSPLAASLEMDGEARKALKQPCAACPPSTMRTQPWGDGPKVPEGVVGEENPSAGSGSSRGSPFTLTPAGCSQWREVTAHFEASLLPQRLLRDGRG